MRHAVFSAVLLKVALFILLTKKKVWRTCKRRSQIPPFTGLPKLWLW